MKLPYFADPENLKTREEPTPEPIRDDVPLQELAEQVVRGKVKLGRDQMRMLIELLPYLRPKLTAIAYGALTAEDFYSRLERAINRSERAKLIEGRAERVDD
jgi:hypothetical protein